MSDPVKGFVFIGASMVAGVIAFGDKFTDRTDENSVGMEQVNLARESGPRVAVGYRDRRGHFSFNTSMNGRNVKVLVDTGASSVAINEKTAKRIGLRLKRSDFKHRANTANGTALFARATIRELKIGRITVRNVPAAVLSDSALTSTLLGMSFLNRLKRFEFNGNKLTLIQ